MLNKIVYYLTYTMIRDILNFENVKKWRYCQMMKKLLKKQMTFILESVNTKNCIYNHSEIDETTEHNIKFIITRKNSSKTF